jgi:hypothetical protein
VSNKKTDAEFFNKLADKVKKMTKKQTDQEGSLDILVKQKENEDGIELKGLENNLVSFTSLLLKGTKLSVLRHGQSPIELNVSDYQDSDKFEAFI